MSIRCSRLEPSASAAERHTVPRLFVRLRSLRPSVPIPFVGESVAASVAAISKRRAGRTCASPGLSDWPCAVRRMVVARLVSRFAAAAAKSIVRLVSLHARSPQALTNPASEAVFFDLLDLFRCSGLRSRQTATAFTLDLLLSLDGSVTGQAMRLVQRVYLSYHFLLLESSKGP